MHRSFPGIHRPGPEQGADMHPLCQKRLPSQNEDVIPRQIRPISDFVSQCTRLS